MHLDFIVSKLGQECDIDEQSVISTMALLYSFNPCQAWDLRKSALVFALFISRACKTQETHHTPHPLFLKLSIFFCVFDFQLVITFFREQDKDIIPIKSMPSIAINTQKQHHQPNIIKKRRERETEKKKYTAALTVNLHMALYDGVPGNVENSLFLGKKVKDKKDILFNHGGILILLCLLFSKPAIKRCGESQSVQKMHFKRKRLSKDFFFGSLSFTNEQKHVFLPEFSLSFSSYVQFSPKNEPIVYIFIIFHPNKIRIINLVTEEHVYI